MNVGYDRNFLRTLRQNFSRTLERRTIHLYIKNRTQTDDYKAYFPATVLLGFTNYLSNTMTSQPAVLEKRDVVGASLIRQRVTSEARKIFLGGVREAIA